MRAARNRENLVALCMLAGAVLFTLGRAARASDPPLSATPAAAAPRMLYPPFQHAPLDGPLIQTGSFGEYRPGRFHAGCDLSTGEVVGQPVYAPLDGFIERVRASGVGYGRSLYLRAADGRLVLLGHLDAFDEPVASLIAAAQDSSGQYEQDLWLDASRARVHAGQRLGWSGRSGGVGQPHLHLEVRRGDMALNPLLAGASIVDSGGPVITAITIEPRTQDSRINGRFAPVRLMAGAAPETVRVEGYARIEVEARDPGVRRADIQPYEIELRWGAHFVRCAFDSLSWATDMPEGPLIYDAGRTVEERRHAVLMWAPAGFRPRAITSDAPKGEEAGVLDGPREGGVMNARVTARDLAGHEVSRSLVLRFAPASTAIGKPSG
ncbi:MAG: M23 family metallopeptidase, partial [Candidatus Eiseniibacteriota bacterium]